MTEPMMFDITTIVVGVIGLLVLVITIFLIPLLKSKKTQAEWNNMLSWIEIGVKAAEQIFPAGSIDEKKKYVLALLEAKGFHIDAHELDAAIEAAVLDLHHALYEVNGLDGYGGENQNLPMPEEVCGCACEGKDEVCECEEGCCCEKECSDEPAIIKPITEEESCKRDEMIREEK